MTYMTWLQLPHVPRTMQRSDVIIHNGQMSTPFPFLLFLKKDFYFWFHWVLIPVRGLSLAVASGGCSLWQCTGVSLEWFLLLRSTNPRARASVGVVHGLSCPVACGIFLDQGLNPCPLHGHADSDPLYYQGSPPFPFCFHRIIADILRIQRRKRSFHVGHQENFCKA